MEEKLLNLLTAEMPDIDFSSDSLVDDGILDSVLITEIISHISMEFNVQIPYEEVKEENFNSLSAMVALVDKLQK